ncbi:MAG: ion transporter [Bacteroidales bacterium]|nr:ion transporter [Bacteroidales bacterium]
MNQVVKTCERIVSNKTFEFAITFVILLNAVLIGVETYTDNVTVKLIQDIILYIYTVEILIRFVAANSLKKFFTNGWNIFDLTLVLIGYIPDSLAEDSASLMSLRLLRVFRVLRLLRSAKELQLIVTVLLRSMSAMFYNFLLFLIFVYLYAIIGVFMFRLPDPETLSGDAKERYEQYIAEAPHAPGNSPDPFGDLGEAIFTLFRELTGDDWTDLRYNHITAAKYGVIKSNSTIITTYHVTWFCLAAYLLLNLVTGAVLNNYQQAREEKDTEDNEQ